MGDLAYNAAGGEQQQQQAFDDQKNIDSNPNARAAFQSQLEHLSHAQQGHDFGSYRQPLNMGSLSHALPHMPPSPLDSRGHFGPDLLNAGAPSPHNMHQMHHGGGMDQLAAARAQQMHQAQYTYPPYVGISQVPQPMRHMHLPAQYSNMGIYGVHQLGGPQHVGLHNIDPRFAQPPGAGFAMMPAMGNTPAQFAHRAPEPAPVPSFPRGPPRKPKQSGHALWVGNLPPAARIEDLKDHFSRDATTDIESVFLISKSNCAFVNYRSEAACSEAMTRFHDSKFHGVRLVCRLRRNTGTASGTPSTPTGDEGSAAGSSKDALQKRRGSNQPQDPDSPVIVGGSHIPSPTAEKSAAVVDEDPTRGGRAPARYFIVKSLTVQDLESSIRTGIWATQNHNESVFNEAYQNADSVYLVFSANKSGEYFGYARMASKIAGQPVNLNAKGATDDTQASGTPQAIETPATDTAPKGRIIDDSARGTIFWEAVLSSEDDCDLRELEKDEEGFESTPGSNWGRQFSIEWISTARLPFYRTRGLRNPWNSQREVKIARDGTELESSIGRRLVSMFHGPSGAHQQAMAHR